MYGTVERGELPLLKQGEDMGSRYSPGHGFRVGSELVVAPTFSEYDGGVFGLCAFARDQQPLHIVAKDERTRGEGGKEGCVIERGVEQRLIRGAKRESGPVKREYHHLG